MPGERYRKATISTAAVLSNIYISLELAEDLISYVDPTSEKRMILGGTNRRASGEVRTEEDCSSLFGTTDVTAPSITFLDAAGSSNLVISLTKITFHQWKGETSIEDTKPAKFSLGLEIELPDP